MPITTGSRFRFRWPDDSASGISMNRRPT